MKTGPPFERSRFFPILDAEMAQRKGEPFRVLLRSDFLVSRPNGVAEVISYHFVSCTICPEGAARMLLSNTGPTSLSSPGGGSQDGGIRMVDRSRLSGLSEVFRMPED